MKITIICSSREHPIYPYLKRWSENIGKSHEVQICQRQESAAHGDLLFCISCHELISIQTISRFRHTLVIHASDLPDGRGWSPHIWQILDGADQIVLTLFEADEALDSGPIWKKLKVDIPRTALSHEINTILFKAELLLMNFAVENIDSIKPQTQSGRCTRSYRRRTPADSELDPEKSISSQFDLMRVSDPERFPPFFRFRGEKYRITLEKLK